MTKLINALQDIGLSEHEVKTYLASLELGAATVQEIAKKSGVKRTTIYTFLPHLKSLGLIVEFKKSGKTYFTAEKPSHLEELMKERLMQLQSLMPELTSIYRSPSLKPKVRFFEGKNGIKQVYQDTLTDGKEILCIPAWHAMVDAMPDFWEWYIRARVERGLRVRALAERSKESEHYKQREKEDLRELRFLPADALPFSTEVNIYGNKVAMVTFAKEWIGVIIESQEIAATWRMVFEVIWKIAQIE